MEAVVFDFGGVLLDLDMDRTFKALTELTNVSISMEQWDTAPFFDHYRKYEKGLINDETFIWNIQNLANGDPDPRSVVRAWNAMLLGWNPDRLEMLLELRKSYRVFLLSNTNHLHIQWVLQDLKHNHGVTDFDNAYFDKAYYSYKMHMRKPDAEIYQAVTKQAALLPAKTLFIDDNADNVAAAKAYGWQAVVHDPHKWDIVDAIAHYLAN